MGFFQNVSPRKAGNDLVSFLKGSKHNPLLMLAACVPPAIIIAMFYFDAMSKAKPPPPEVIYFESWPATRSIEESKAAITEYQKQKDAARAREKEAYKAFGRAVGMDVDRIEREAEADRIATKKANAAAEAKKAGATK